MDKKISVIITCHPPVEKYLEECVASVKGQTQPPHEIILVLDSYEKPYTFGGVTTIVRDQNVGVAKSRHQGVLQSTGDHLLFLDADDALPETFLAEIVKCEADIVYPNVLLWSHWSEKPRRNIYYESPRKITEADMLRFNRVVVTSLMKRQVYDQIGGFREMPVFEDYRFFMDALSRGLTFKRANTYLKYRQRQDSRNRQSDEVRKKTYQEVIDSYQHAKV